jgi:hypothetical protein
MSIYVMTVGELAKKRGESVGDFVKKVQSVGFNAGSHAKKLTQQELDVLIGMLDGTYNNESSTTKPTKVNREVTNPNVLMLKSSSGKNLIAFVDAVLKDDGTIEVDIIESVSESSLGDTLLEFRKQLGIKLGVN